MPVDAARSGQIIERCRALARLSEEPGRLIRTFLSPPTHDVHALLRSWMEAVGATVHIDAAGNLRGFYDGCLPGGPRLLIGSHIDTVPDAGAFDGVLGVVLGIALIEALGGRRLRFGIEVIAFSEEEGVRFGVPFLGSRALIGSVDSTLLSCTDRNGVSVARAMRDFGLDPAQIPGAALREPALGYVEFHIEQGPVLESLDLPLGVVETIVGQSRLQIWLRGKANHAGTTPMHLRRDALAGAAEWIRMVERAALVSPPLVATVGEIEAQPGAGNVIAGAVRVSLDVRHPDDAVRLSAADELVEAARSVAHRRGLEMECETRMNQASAALDRGLVAQLARAVERAGFAVHRMPSGAAHDAMVMAGRLPAAMLFLRSPGGISHHPDESVLAGDVEAAVRVGLGFLEELETTCINSD